MTRDLAEVILEALKQDDTECELFENYSGKCMYGKKTTGISGEFTIVDVLSSVIAHADLFVLDGEAIFCGEELRQDQLGLGNIIY